MIEEEITEVKNKKIKLQDKIFDDFSINRAMIGLQWLCISLKAAVRKLPNSAIKQYLVFEVVKSTKLKSIADVNKLYNKIFNVIDVATMENFNEISELAKVLKLLENIKNVLEEIIDCDKKTEKILKRLVNSNSNSSGSGSGNGKDKVRLVAVG